MPETAQFTPDEWDRSAEARRMLDAAFRSGTFSSRKQLLYCAGVARLNADAEFRPILDELELFADRADLPGLCAGERLYDQTQSWRRDSDVFPGTPIAGRMADMVQAAGSILARRIAERIPQGDEYFEGYPGFTVEEANLSAVMGHVYGASIWEQRPGAVPQPQLWADLLRDLLGNPFRPVTCDSAWKTDTVIALARGMYDSRDFSPMPILADALQDAGCNNDEILSHSREGRNHARGCWLVDLLLSKS